METTNETIEALMKIEANASFALNSKAWKLAEQGYRRFLQTADGFLAPEDPNVLWVKTHLSEVLIESDHDGEADSIHHEILKKIARPDTDVERDILEQTLRLRVDMVLKLNAQRQRKKALEVLEEALEYSLVGLDPQHEVTESIRESRDRVTKQLFKKFQRDIDRLKKAKEERNEILERRKPDSKALSDVVHGTHEHQIQEIAAKSPTVRLISPPNNKDDDEVIVLDRNASESPDLRTAKLRNSSVPDEFPRGLSQPPVHRGRSPPSKNFHSDVLTDKLKSGAHPSLSSDFNDLMHLSGTPSSYAPGHPDISSQPRPLLVRQGTLRARSVDYSAQNDQSNRLPKVADDSTPDFSDAALLSGSEDDYKSTDKWFSQFLKETHDLLAGLGTLNSAPGLRPRIAILDTGLNTKHPKVQELLNKKGKERRIRDFWPSTGSLPANEDEDGHGTHCAMVAHKVAPNADLYIARVFKDRNSVNGDRVVEAIEHAVTTWQVDIINMSFAISRDDHETKSAMTKKIQEVENKVLMFAAASNSGQTMGRTYPAKRPEIFCIHAAGGGGAAWGQNPGPYMDDWPNFSTLGMYVEAPHGGQETKRVTGTSVAAPVAAGIAALVLEFCRQPLVGGQDPIMHPQNLKTKRGMKIIFRQMQDQFEPTTKDRTKSYFYLRPWDLISLRRGNGDDEKARKEIAVDINRALNSLID